MAEHVQVTRAATNIASKIKASAISSGAAIVLLAVLTAVTPDMFSWAGQWSALLYAGVVGLAGVIAGYVKKDVLPVTDPGADGAYKVTTL